MGGEYFRAVFAVMLSFMSKKTGQVLVTLLLLLGSFFWWLSVEFHSPRIIDLIVVVFVPSLVAAHHMNAIFLGLAESNKTNVGFKYLDLPVQFGLAVLSLMPPLGYFFDLVRIFQLCKTCIR